MPGTPDPALLELLRSALDPAYEIERELRGGMSRVFVATERALNRRVVLKVLPPELTAGVNRDRFRREIQFAARLQHPHIVPLLTAGQVGDILYYTMPLVEGETLRTRLEREGRLGAAAVMRILQDVVDALAYAHANGLVHRDIKPENILLQRHHALVTDFGVAKAITEALPGIGATTAGIAVGTPAYMAPEQLAADPAADHRVDLYAVGLLAYELLSGGSPFTGSSPQQTLARQLTERPTPPHIQRADVPPALSSLIMRCLEKDPAARWSSADELLTALNGIRITSSEIPAVTRTERITVRQSGWRRGLIIGAGVTLSVLMAFGAYRRWTPAHGPDSAKATDSVRQVDSPDSTPPAAHAPNPPAPPAAPSVLTRADSEAIAASVAKRMNRQRPAVPGLTQRELDSIRNVVEKSVTDSVLRMIGPARRGTPGLPDAQTMVKLGDIAGLTDLRIMGGRRPFRVAIPPLADGSPDQSLHGLAAAIAESLSRAAKRQPLVRVFTGASGRSLAQRLESPHPPGDDAGADALVQGVVRPVGGDSVEAVFQLRDGSNLAVAKMVRHAMLKEEAAMLPAAVTPMITAWIEYRERESRPARATGFSPQVLDSMLRETQRLRENFRRKPTSRPDSAPPRPPG
jgi:serine/threonine protein kinase